MNRKLWFLLKFTSAAGIILFLFFKYQKSFMASLRDFNVLWLIPAIFLYMVQIAACAWRWQRLTKIAGFALSFKQAFSLTMQGCFFSLVLPGGAVGGDFAKIVVLTKVARKGTRAEGIFSILIDRIVGMMALFGLALALLPTSVPVILNIDWGFGKNTALSWTVIAILLSMCISGILMPGVLFFHRSFARLPWVGTIIALVNRRTNGLWDRFCNVIDLYRSSWREILFQVLICIFSVHLMASFAVFFLAYGLGNFNFNAPALIAAVVFGNIVALIPLFPNGIGGRDIVIFSLLSAAGISGGLTITILNTLLIVVCSLAGAPFAFFNHRWSNTGIGLEKSK